MTWPVVQINQVNQLQGETDEIERVLLFVGTGDTNTGKTLAVNTQSDLDALLGADASPLKGMVSAAMLNAGQNWSGFIRVLASGEEPESWVDAVRAAQQVASVEGVVFADDIADKAAINEAAKLRAELLAKYGRWVWFILAVQGPQDGEAWADYLERLSTLQSGIAAESVQLVPRLWGNEPGVLAGRLCSRAVTIADSPCRVATGALVDMGADDLPVDGTGATLELATLQALESQRYSVPMWYPDYDGYYWADGRTLDVEGGDYQAIEYLRIVDKVARRVRLQAIAKLGDRSLNSTPGSIAAHQSYFAKTLREMAVTSQINGVTFPGEVKPPQDGDVTIVWKSSTQVEIYIVVRPYECPKGITVSIVLDTSLAGSE
ncbi:DUF2586 domain-containing protein [Jejubacter calystegiae]|uniref:DUF2586 domain-containing protein n=1 Tax=Jejubacter calystegiae TaxID=2579935 RepID=A0A4V1G757_9ENTR|nr:DUF2586 domain-containing protein [Jejubacter calystegiae]QCT18487.1 DUF2586 domain-containing protein [Jejubacter calystegiae]